MTRNQVKSYLESRWSGDAEDQACVQYILDLYDNFKLYNLADQNFEIELTNGNEEAFHQHVFEMQLAKKLVDHGFAPDSQDNGPDFKITHDNKTIWIEAITPSRGSGDDQVPSSDLGDAAFAVRDLPYEKIRRRYTAAISEKKNKLDRYLRQGIISENDSYIIAINQSIIDWDFEDISQHPYAVTSVFPVGPMTLTINRNSGNVTDRGYQYQPLVFNHNNAPITCDNFMNPAYRYVSGIYAIREKPFDAAVGNHRPSVVTHNPLAQNPFSVGLIPADKEYYVHNRTEPAETWQLKIVGRSTGSAE